MSPAETASTLRLYNAWRRGDEDLSQPDPYEIGRAIDSAVEEMAEAQRLRHQNAILMETIEAALQAMAATPAWHKMQREAIETLQRTKNEMLAKP